MPLLQEMLEAVGYSDEQLCADIVKGFPVCGEMHCGGMGIRVEGGRKVGGKPARGEIHDIANLRARCAEINAATLERAIPGPLAAEVWQQTKKYVEQEGMVGALRPVGEVDLDAVLLVHRFGVEESRASGRKVRVIDKFKSNGANSFTVAWEASHNDREDVVSEAILKLQEELRSVGCDDDVLVGLEDCVGAFKTVAPEESQRWLMHVLVWDSDRDPWVVGELYTMPFGAVGGVLS